jgi:hypothetical protein
MALRGRRPPAVEVSLGARARLAALVSIIRNGVVTIERVTTAL